MKSYIINFLSIVISVICWGVCICIGIYGNKFWESFATGAVFNMPMIIVNSVLFYRNYKNKI